MTGRLIMLNDVYSFNPDTQVRLDDTLAIINRSFEQPEAGLGFDNSPEVHK